MRAVIRCLTLAVPIVVVLLVVPAVAQADELPSLAWSPMTSSGAFDFGAVAVGQAVSQIFTLTNVGGSASSALTLTLTGSSAFSLTPNRCTPTSLGPNRSCTVAVKFVSDSSAAESATLTATGEKRAAVATLSLTGTGTEPVAGNIYWANSGDCTVGAKLAGTDPQILIPAEGPCQTVNVPRGVAVDASHIYWADFSHGTIDVANLDGTEQQSLPLDAGDPEAIAVDAGHIYWFDASHQTIDVADLPGGGNSHALIGPIGVLGLAVDASHIYWTDAFDSSINAANLDGTNKQTLITGSSDPFTQPAGIAVDASHIYWADFANGTINEANLDGSHPQLGVVTGEESPFGVAVDASHIYWTDVFVGTIHDANLDGSDPQPLVGGQSNPFGLAVSG